MNDDIAMPVKERKLSASRLYLQELLEELNSDALEWEQRALCRETKYANSTDLFFSLKEEEIRKAKAICRQCPVQAQCLELALVTGENYGVWGGASVKERRNMLRRRREAVGNKWNQAAHAKLKEEIRLYLPNKN